ncbi:MAG: hypothetical protein VX701_03945 [Chloroflexota bacterium]|nr:hypothetical protein [Chloroflexota bacterium]
MSLTSDPSEISDSRLPTPEISLKFVKALDELVSEANRGHDPKTVWNNPDDSWLLSQVGYLDSLNGSERSKLLEESAQLEQLALSLSTQGRAAEKVWPKIGVRLKSGGLASFSQLGVRRRPDITKYFIDGFPRNRHANLLTEEDQEILSDILPYITDYMRTHFQKGDSVIQSDRQIGDVADRSFHARQLLFGSEYPHVAYMWRKLTFQRPEKLTGTPDILEVSVPHWLDILTLPDQLKTRVQKRNMDKLILKAPTKGLSLHLGFDYVGEHKMGPLSTAMFMVKQSGGIAIQAALSMARTNTLNGIPVNTALVTVGPSLHGKSTLTIMLELENSELAHILNLSTDKSEGVYPMNDDIVMLQRTDESSSGEATQSSNRYPYSIDGTEDNFYAVPFGLTKKSDPITYDVIKNSSNSDINELLENVPLDLTSLEPNYGWNPVQNMRMILDRKSLLDRKGVATLLNSMTDSSLSEAVHVPMEHTDKIFFQSVMRQNTIIPPLRRVSLEEYIRVLMFGEAVQMGASTGSIGQPYVEYFSDPFIIGLEDENANSLYRILKEFSALSKPSIDFYVFNTGGVGSDSNVDVSGLNYKKIPRELTLLLQEALLRECVVFEHDDLLGSDIATGVINSKGETVVDLTKNWLPNRFFDKDDYTTRVENLSRVRYYGTSSEDKSGILQYTKTQNDIIDFSQIPEPRTVRELSWLISFYWNTNTHCNNLEELKIELANLPSVKHYSQFALLKLKCGRFIDGNKDLPTEDVSFLKHLQII